MKRYYLIVIALLAAVVASSGVALAASGAGGVSVGYHWADEEGNLGVNQETFNFYEGVGISLVDWRYQLDNGMAVDADLRNITLNNRNLRAGFHKPGLFGLNVTNNQYRRIYDYNGNNFTRRRTTTVNATIRPVKYVEVFGGFGTTAKHGTDYNVLPSAEDTVVRSTDYSHSNFSVGAAAFCNYGTLRADYRHFGFNDKSTADADRKADQFTLTGSAPLPRYRNLLLSAGYSYRKDQTDYRDPESELKTKQSWAGAKLYLKPEITVDYRFLWGMLDHVYRDRSADHILNTISIGKNFARVGGLRVGYENYLADNYVDKTTSTGYLADGWLRPTERLLLTARITTRNRENDEGSAFAGQQDDNRHRVMAQYRDARWGDLTARWISRTRENKDLTSKVDYDALSGTLGLVRSEWGRLEASYTYYVGKFENRSDQISYEFQDHMLSGHVYPRAIGPVTLDFGASYYRSRRDNDIEKSNLDFGAVWTFRPEHHLEVRYNVYNFDDFHFTDQYYTGNIVEVNLIKDIQF